MTSAKIPPKPAKETIYVDVDDEITSIIDKLENAKAKVVALVLPKRSSALQSTVNMRLLKKSADNVNKNIVLITSESALMPLAGLAGLHVAKNLQSKPEIPDVPKTGDKEAPTDGDKIDLTGTKTDDKVDEEDLPIKINYDQSIGELAGDDEQEEDDIVEVEDKKASKKLGLSGLGGMKIPNTPKIKVPNFDKFRISLGLAIFALAGLIIFFYLAGSVLPKATVTIKTTSTPVSANLALTTSDQAKTVDTAKNIIPAVIKTSDQTLTQQVNATGQQNTGEKAKGSVKMTAGDCSASVPSDVAAGTGITTSGLTFITQSAISFEPKISGGKCTFQSTDSTSIVAISGGSKYNIGASTFTVAGRSGVSATSTAATTGGTDSVQATVAQADLDGVSQKITSASSDTFSKTFMDQLTQQGFYVLSATLKLSDAQTSSAPAVGQPASTATVTVKITYSVLVVKTDDLKIAINAALASQVDKTKQKVEDTDLIKGATISVANQTSPTAMTLNIIEETKAVPVLDSNSVKNLVKGKKKGDIETQLGAIDGVKSVNVKYSPFWVSTVPKKTSKITVVVTHVSG